MTDVVSAMGFGMSTVIDDVLVPVRYSASDRLGSSDLMMSRGLRRCLPDHLLVTYGDTVLFFFPPSSPQKILRGSRVCKVSSGVSSE